MFAQSGLRFDQDFLNKTFDGRGASFQFFSGPGGFTQSSEERRTYSSQRVVKKPNFFERQIIKLNRKIGKFLIKRAFGIDLDKPFDGQKKYNQPR